MIEKEVNFKIKELETNLKTITEAIQALPEGRLRIAQTRNPQFFLMAEVGDTKGTYIKKSDQEIVGQLAQRDYYDKLIAEIKKELSVLKSFEKAYDSNGVNKVYSEMKPIRKSLISPLYVDDNEFAERWMSKSNDKNVIYPDELVYRTVRGEMVRSKSEKMIADMYYELGVPYKYENPVTLLNGITKYPDFTILNKVKRKEMYHEHLGMLEDEEYRINNLKKIRDYELNGIVLGKNLILSYETSYTPFDIELLKRNIMELLD